MSIADSILKEVERLDPWQRDERFEKVARDYGQGFARVLREEFSKRQRKNSQ
jgi:hypothetical protein